MQLTKFSKLKIIHTPGKNLTVADMLPRIFTKEQLQVHQLRHKQLQPQIHFSIMKDNQLKPVHYLVKHEESNIIKRMIVIFTIQIRIKETKYVYHLYSSMQLLTNFMLTDTQE